MQRLKDIRGLKYPDEYVIRFFFKHGLHNSPGRALEAGCANGCNLRLFREYGWNTIGIDINRDSISDAEANFAAESFHGRPAGAQNACRFVRHDLKDGLPQGLGGPFDCLLFPSSLYYIPRASMVQVLTDVRRIARLGAAFYLRMRTVADFRFGRGEPVERNGFHLTTEITGERGALNVFYEEHELVEMLRDFLSADPSSMKVLHVDYQNVQNETVVSNSDIVIWGRLPC